MADSGAAQDNPPKRHCAFCLQLKPFQLCTGCNRRAYCSTRCRDQDWKPSRKGQGHKNWCKIEHGQEDVDWEVRPIPGKGLGIVAKRLIPSKYKIIVEGVHFSRKSHPSIADLAPEDGTLTRKFQSNLLWSEHLDDPFVALRICRVNHSCSQNAQHIYCKVTNVCILYACRDIQEGEEICRHYEDICDRVMYRHPLVRDFSIEELLFCLQQVLENVYGIICPQECVCNSPEFKSNITKLSDWHRAFEEEQTSNPTAALGIAENIITLMTNELYACWETIADFHRDCSKVTAQEDVRLHHSKKFWEITSALSALPESVKDVLERERFVELFLL